MEVDEQVSEVLLADRLGSLTHRLLHPVEIRLEAVAEDLVDVTELELGPDATEDALGPRERLTCSEPSQVALGLAEAIQNAPRERA